MHQHANVALGWPCGKTSLYRDPEKKLKRAYFYSVSSGRTNMQPVLWKLVIVFRKLCYSNDEIETLVCLQNKDTTEKIVVWMESFSAIWSKYNNLMETKMKNELNEWLSTGDKLLIRSCFYADKQLSLGSNGLLLNCTWTYISLWYLHIFSSLTFGFSKSEGRMPGSPFSPAPSEHEFINWKTRQKWP